MEPPAPKRCQTWWASIGSPTRTLAPLVDQSEYAFRLLCRARGAELCSTPMFDARRFADDEAYREASFGPSEGGPGDRPLVVQFCSDDPDATLAAARRVDGRCDAVELNCGCPQKFAQRDHFGAFLLDEPEVIERIVRALAAGGLRCAVAVKVRILPDVADTVALASRLERAGCELLTVHGRTRQQKKCGHPCDFEAIAAVKRAVSIPVVANGGVEGPGDFDEVRRRTGCDAVMSGEYALENPAVFGGAATTRSGQLEVARAYAALAQKHCPGLRVAKLHLEKMLYVVSGAAAYAAVQRAGTLDELWAALDGFGGAPDDGPPGRTWYLRHRASADDVRAFVAARPDAVLLPSGRVRCELTGHEMAPQLGEMRAHWGGRRYRNARKRRKL
mmetsp:Transcript_29519/g.88269  ORF Transcript_29519/g.88269 Transcript_29519/m.88269 type:complete len:389 (+) Transcript_29519:191-1357(+)